MARLILKSPYIKSTGGAAGYLRYIATRERVEILPDDRPPTRKQEQLIAKLVKDFPDTKTLYEYASYQAKPTKAAASALLTLALESNWDALRQSEQYLKYIATRPRAERLGSHGLFGDSDGVSLEKAMKELEQYTGNVWTHILSLKREDAARLGFDNAAAWRNLIRAHRNEIAAAMKIPPADFRWYAAFHDEGEHPHVHMMAWSAKPGQAYLTKEGIRQIKSRLTNDIFRDEMLHLYEQKSASRDELVRQARRAMLELVQAMQDGLCDHPEAELLMQELAAGLGTVKGKKTYGYLPKRLKRLVDEIVDQMDRLPIVRQCYDQWLLLQGKVDGYYHDTPRERLPLSKEKEFRQIKNAVIREAERLRLGQITFEDQDMGQRDEPEQFRNASNAYWTLQEVIRNEELTMEERRGIGAGEAGEGRRLLLSIPAGQALAGRSSADPRRSRGPVLVRAGRPSGASGSAVRPRQAVPLGRSGGARHRAGHGLAAHCRGGRKPLGHVSPGQRTAQRPEHETGCGGRGGVVHPICRARRSLCPVSAGQAVSHGKGSAPG